MTASSSQRIKYVYILSQRYSGSTLLSFLLATHPEISTLGERRKFYNKVLKSHLFQHHKAKHCSCGLKFVDCPYLDDIKTRVVKGLPPEILESNVTEMKIFENKYLNRVAYEVNKSFAFAGLSQKLNPFRKIVNQHQVFNKKLVESTLKKDETTVFLDSSKIINHAFYLSQIKDFDFHVVWLVRDPRAQVNSAIKYHKWPIDKAVNSWKREMVNNARVLDKLNIKHVTLPYSALCANTETEMKKLFQFIGIDDQKFSLDFRDQEHHIMGNHMRLQKEQKIVERTEWKNQLSQNDIDFISERTKAYRQFYSST